jgi:hypothetical protein
MRPYKLPTIFEFASRLPVREYAEVGGKFHLPGKRRLMHALGSFVTLRHLVGRSLHIRAVEEQDKPILSSRYSCRVNDRLMQHQRLSDSATNGRDSTSQSHSLSHDKGLYPRLSF